MCGIVGLITDLPMVEAGSLVAHATRQLRHRGPDGEGLFTQSAGDGGAMLRVAAQVRALPAVRGRRDGSGVVFGHRRLAIIDLRPAALQPMATGDGRYVIVFNGEIYNYLELRDQLLAAGDHFRTASDTEVLLTGYARWGLRVLDRVIGMFAFALLDRAEGTVLLARDCFGMKPLYYGRSARGIGFASEPRTLLSLLGCGAAADVQGLADYLLHGITDHRSGTMFGGIQSVPAASHVRIALADARVERTARYWAPAMDSVDDRPIESIARQLRDLFLQSVQLHLRGEAHVGTLLSGGLDSSAIVMAMREVGGTRLDLRTFSYVPDSGAISEERWIDAVNAAAGAIPHKVRIRHDEWEADASRLIEHQGEPYGSLAVYAQSRLFQCASNHGVRVLLDGQGADETLGGYAFLRAVRLAGHFRRADYRSAIRLARTLSAAEGSAGRMAALYLETLRQVLPVSVEPLARRLGLRPPIADEQWLIARGASVRPPWHLSKGSALRQRLRVAIETSSLPGLLRYTDRGAMMHGIESRLPFLTRPLVEFALTLPDEFFVSDEGVGKAVFRHAMRGIVPDSILRRRDKVGFSVPLGEWLRGTRYARTQAHRAASLPGVNSRRVSPWLTDLSRGRVPSSRRTFLLWRLIGFAEWVDRYDIRFD